MGAGDFVDMITYVEGYRMARLAWGTASAQSITIGFWSAHTRTGLYSGCIRNFDGSRSYAFTYTQNASATPEYKTVTIPGCTDGTWKADNTIGLGVVFTMASGTTLTAPAANVWNTSFFIAAPGQINGVAATTDIFRILGVVVLPGIEAPSAARSPLIMRPYDQELVTCQRYYKQTQQGTGISYATTSVRFIVPMGVMRTPPTAGLTSPLQVSDTAGNFTQSVAAVGTVTPGRDHIQADFANFTGMTVNRSSMILATGGAITLDARL
jgi:hypothetical protein